MSHDHVFGQDQIRPGERKTRLVIGLTAATMAVEIGAGLVFGSMALLADGLHMGSHAVALTVAAAAYANARRHARDPRFSFGTGKVNALGGFAGAVLLAGFALWMAVESVDRVLRPVPIAFTQAILVAVLGLGVNGASLIILGDRHHHHSDHDHDHDHGPGRGSPHPHRGRVDLALRSAYLHVLADALTSVLAILALGIGKVYGWVLLDPLMGFVGAGLVARWSIGLVRETSRVLLDHQAPPEALVRLRAALESDGTARVEDLHLWSIGPGLWAADLVVVAACPGSAESYRRRIPESLHIVHATVETRREEPAPQGAGGGTDADRA